MPAAVATLARRILLLLLRDITPEGKWTMHDGDEPPPFPGGKRAFRTCCLGPTVINMHTCPGVYRLAIPGVWYPRTPSPSYASYEELRQAAVDVLLRTYTHTHIHLHIHLHIQIHIHVHMHVHIHVHIHIHVHVTFRKGRGPGYALSWAELGPLVFPLGNTQGGSKPVLSMCRNHLVSGGESIDNREGWVGEGAGGMGEGEADVQECRGAEEGYSAILNIHQMDVPDPASPSPDHSLCNLSPRACSPCFSALSVPGAALDVIDLAGDNREGWVGEGTGGMGEGEASDVADEPRDSKMPTLSSRDSLPSPSFSPASPPALRFATPLTREPCYACHAAPQSTGIIPHTSTNTPRTHAHSDNRVSRMTIEGCAQIQGKRKRECHRMRERCSDCIPLQCSLAVGPCGRTRG